MLKISIIVPVYNSEETLSRCVDSILRQTFSDFELLLVDDGSSDTSWKICEKYARLDSRVRAFHKENGGPGSARNAGMNKAQGDFVTFIDSDDWIEPDYVSNLVYAVSSDVDLVISNYGDKKQNEEIEGWLIQTANLQLLFEAHERCYIVPWGKLYRSQIINDFHLRFDEGMCLGEDVAFIYAYMVHSTRIYLQSGNAGYHYETERTNSLSKRIFPIKQEIYSYQIVRKAIRDLIIAKRIVDGAALDKLNQLEVYFISRILCGIY